MIIKIIPFVPLANVICTNWRLPWTNNQ